MYVTLGIIAVLFIVISLIGTLIVGKQVNKRLKTYRQHGSAREEILRSRSYETTSVKKHGMMLVIVWGITILISVLGFTLFML